MLVILPGHVRGMIVLGGDCPACETSHASKKAASCCGGGQTTPAGEPTDDRKSRCAICDQARGYSEVPVFEFAFKPTGLLELCRLIEPTKLHQLLTESPYFATAPPARFA